jgi:hypothetical protein
METYMKAAVALGLAAALVIAARPALAAGEVPAGRYACAYNSGTVFMRFGDIEFASGQYRGPAFDGKYGSWYPYQLGSDNVVLWGGPLEGFTSGGNTVLASTLETEKSTGRPYIRIVLRSSSGSTMTTTCSRQ